MPPSELLVDQVRPLLQGEPGLSERKMFGGLCFMINGNMACGITGKDDLMLRVGPDAYESVLQQEGVRKMDFTGRPMKGMVFVDPKSCADAEAMAAWLEQALSLLAHCRPNKIFIGSVCTKSLSSSKPMEACPNKLGTLSIMDL